jgi:DNA-binding GntR family transcriptional regulator
VTSRLHHRSLSDEASEALRDMILTGELRPEQRVTQDELALALGTSTMPIREALLKLSHEGLVRASPNRSFRVVRSTREDIRDIYWIHAVLAGELAARSCRRQTEDGDLVRRLTEHHDAMVQAAARGDSAGMEAANWSFHREINLLAGAPKLLLILKAALRSVPTHFYSLVDDWAPISQRGHQAILKALRRGDAEGTRAAAMQHVTEAGELIIAHFSDGGYWSRPGSG